MSLPSLPVLPEHRLSVVAPMYDEEECVGPFFQAVHEALGAYRHPWELVVVDDGSRDGTWRRLVEEAERHGKHVRLARLRRNFGQTAAMQAGIDLARGDVVATLDGDLQNEPADIPALLQTLFREDLDLVVGWRKPRKDGLWLRRIPSVIANCLIRRITGVRLRDYGCSLKVYRTPVIRAVRLYGEMHRFIPAWVAIATSTDRIREQPVAHRARKFGQSKYGLSRALRVALDLLSVFFFMRFRARPGHFFGQIGLCFGLLGGGILGYLLALKVFLGQQIGTRPLLTTGVLFVVVSVQFLTTGLLAELLARTYFESSDAKPYGLREGAGLSICAEEGWREPLF